MELEEQGQEVEMAVAEAAATEAAKSPGFFIVGDGNSSSSNVNKFRLENSFSQENGRESARKFVEVGGG